MKYKHVVLGGTFDHLHEGHKHFILSAFKKGEKVTIGLTTDEFSKYKMFSESIENFKARQVALEVFLKNNGFLERAKIIKIDDPFGTTLTDKSIDAIFVTSHGLKNATLINKKRKQKGLSKLTINKVSYLRGIDNKIISSTRVRNGEIDRFGTPYINLFNKTLALPSSLRSTVKNTPSGKLISAAKLSQINLNDQFIIAIGDATTNALKVKKVVSDINIVDFVINRKPIGKQFSKNAVKNLPSTINRAAVLRINNAIKNISKKKNQTIETIGEEDLLALPATLLAPLNTRVFYGMRGKGIVVVSVSEEIKNDVVKVVKKFKG